MQRFARHSPEQLSGYRLYFASEPAEVEAFLEMLRAFSLHVGIAGGPSGEGDASATFAVLEPEMLARVLGQPGTVKT